MDRSRIATSMMMAVGLTMLVASGAHSTPRLVFNASESVPRGWYAIAEVGRPQPGDYVLVQLPQAVRVFAAQRGYLPARVPLIKPVAAVGGQRVCVDSGTVRVDGVAVARTLASDGNGRPLPKLTLCRVLSEDEVFLLATASPASFDSRYFGPVDRSFLRGQANPWRIAASE
jgi:conjugative transfer signal peptidase TraF